MDAEQLKSTMTISKAITLLSDKNSCNMMQRHIRALNRIVINYGSGYQLKDLSSLGHLLLLCTEKVQKSPEYEEPMCRLIHLCSKPFLKEKASDESRYAAAVIETFLLLGKMMVKGTELLCCEIAEAAASFYCNEQEESATQIELQNTKRTYNAVLIERSSVARYIAESLKLAKSVQTYMKLMKSVQILTYSSTNCDHMLSVGVAESVCILLMLNTEVLSLGIDILWNLLQNGSKLQVVKQLGNFKCIREAMVTSFSQQDKQLRNDVLIIISLIASLYPEAPFVETGFLKDLCEFATYSKEDGKLVKLTQDHEDFELKKCLLCLLMTLCTASTAAIQVLSNIKVSRILFSTYVIQNDKRGSDWNFAQFEELQLLALTCLSLLCPECIDDYMGCQGSTRVLLLIEWCNKQECPERRDSSSHNKRVYYKQLGHSLRLLLSMSNTGDEAVLQDMHEQGAIPLIINLLKQFSEQTDLVDDPDHLEMQADCLLILSCLCELNGHRKELFGGYDGVQILVQYLKMSPEKFDSGLGHHRLLLVATDCTWCAVVGNNIVEDIFLENEGVFVLIDLLQSCPKNMRGIVLGVLVDLCDNPKAISHVKAWQGKPQTNIWSLLVQIWQQEEFDLEVPRDVMNTVAGTTLPLVGAEQSHQGMLPLPSNQPSPAVMDVTENNRAKIYALCTKLGFQYPTDGITTEDKITLCIIQSYLDFKAGEVWYEVASELAQEGLRPITPDQEGLQDILQCAEEKTEEIIKQQHELIDEQHRKDLDEEYLFYEQLRDSQLSNERAEEKRTKLVQRTSNNKYLKEAKQQRMIAIDASRPSAVTLGERFHVVDQQSNLNVTVSCGRHVTVATTPMKLLSDGTFEPRQPAATIN